MQHKYLPWFLLFCALGLSTTAAYYSVLGLSIIFTSVAIPVIVMGSFLEVSKIAIATYLHNSWSKIYKLLKIYLTTALVILSLITSIGIYGLLSTGFQENIAKMEIGSKQIQNIKLKNQRFKEIKTELEKEKSILDKDISQLRNGLSTNTTTQSVDKTTGQLITRANNANRKSFDLQLASTQLNKDKLSNKIDALNDSITNLDIKVLNMESKASEGNELGAIQYVSEITGANVKTIANWFILLLIFVFDPLAITLIIATNQAFEAIKPKKNIYGEIKTPEPELQPDPAIEQERQNIIREMDKIQNSSKGSSFSRSSALNDLNNRLSSLNNDNIIRKSKNGWISTNHWLPGFIWFYVQKANSENFLYDIDGIENDVIQYCKYDVGDYYSWHTDYSISSTSNSTRKISFIIQITNPLEYEGREVQFIDEKDRLYHAYKDV